MWRRSHHKFGATRTVRDGIVFHSKKEANRYAELQLLQRSGEIAGLELQPRFKLDIAGVHICDYIADFRYKEGVFIVVEDVKGFRTSEYRIKKNLMKAIYGINILET